MWNGKGAVAPAAVERIVKAPPPPIHAASMATSPVRDLLELADRPDVISFAGGFPDPALLDVPGIRAAFDTALSGDDAGRNLQYSSTEGNAALRELVAERLSGRGLATTGRSLLITTGSQQALTLVATTLLDTRAVVLVEEPTYLAALQCFHLTGAKVVPVPGDEQGILPDALAAVAGREGPTMLYLVPTFANPTGRTLPARRRREVVEIARRHGFWIVEDEPYAELRYAGSDLDPLAAHPAAEQHTLYLGSFSKIGAPGLRIGWVRAPASLLPSLVVVKQSLDLQTSTVDQAAAAHYLSTGALDAQVTRLRVAFRDRRDAMLGALPTTLPDGSAWTRPEGGMFIWARLPEGVDAGRLLPDALAEKVAFVPGQPFHVTATAPETMRLSFTANTTDAIVTGMTRLASVLRRS
ncbi:2-aminoadipate transaminase [Actinoalloteichus cyanogriseus DSM 43889]|uniref:2-aminoadipate transaminase n=2 Tax=Actinoalloteichus cyanogriseus TaxID=2893586 RepID=A0ABT1JDK0_ACTCY|nr:2-aminoadipate transaminase [Actinoalloteichus caeruleus DSM 43889]